MGILSRILGGLDKADNARTDLELKVFGDRRFARAEALAAGGNRNEAVVTGIHRRFQGDSGTVTKVRLEWFAPEPGSGGLLFGDELPPSVRLGSTVAVRSDGRLVALDYGTMRHSCPGAEPAQRTTGAIPDQGIDDEAIDMRVLKAIRSWAPADATLDSWERVSMMGMPTLSWNLRLRRADGSTATVRKDNVPSYCRWFVVPGAALPVRIDPKDAASAKVDWPELAERMAVAGGRWQDPPPAGSIAADLARAPTSVETVATAAAAEPLDVTPSSSSAAAVEGVTIEQWALVEADLARSRVKPAEHDGFATEHHGVPAGRWSAIKRQWESRQLADWRVGAAFGEAYETARRELKKRPR